MSDELKRRIPVSIELGLLGMLVGLVIALPLGVASAVKQDGFVDYGLRSFAIAMLAIPSFFMATMVIALAARFGGYSFPVRYQEWQDPEANLELVAVPALILGIGLSGTLMRLTRAQMLEVLRQDYIRTAHARASATRRSSFATRCETHSFRWSPSLASRCLSSWAAHSCSNKLSASPGWQGISSNP